MSKWKVRVKGRAPVGPLDTELVVRGIQAGRVPLDAEVCAVGDDAWLPLAAIEEFYEATGVEDARTRLMTSPLEDDPCNPASGCDGRDAIDPDDESVTQVMAVPPDLEAAPLFEEQPPPERGGLGHHAFRASRAVSPLVMPDTPSRGAPAGRMPFGSSPNVEISALSSSSTTTARGGGLASAGLDSRDRPSHTAEPRAPTEDEARGRALLGPLVPPTSVEELMDATEDAEDVRVMLPQTSAVPLEGPPGSRKSRSALGRFRPDTPDEQTAPALRVIREHRRAQLAWAAVIVLSVFVLVLLIVLVSRL